MEIPIYQPNEFHPHEVDTKKKRSLQPYQPTEITLTTLGTPRLDWGTWRWPRNGWVTWLKRTHQPERRWFTWVKQCHKPPIFGNGLYNLFMVIWMMVYVCFSFIHVVEMVPLTKHLLGSLHHVAPCHHHLVLSNALAGHYPHLKWPPTFWPVAVFRTYIQHQNIGATSWRWPTTKYNGLWSNSQCKLSLEITISIRENDL